MLLFCVSPVLVVSDFQYGVECVWERGFRRFTNTSSAMPGADAANVTLTAAVDFRPSIADLAYEFVFYVSLLGQVTLPKTRYCA
jgi:hypothetical protein